MCTAVGMRSGETNGGQGDGYHFGSPMAREASGFAYGLQACTHIPTDSGRPHAVPHGIHPTRPVERSQAPHLHQCLIHVDKTSLNGREQRPMKQYIVDAFTDKVFHGNQAAVCVLDEWQDDELMMAITRENNFSETAFTVKEGSGYRLRWFTPGGEIDLCGHGAHCRARGYPILQRTGRTATAPCREHAGVRDVSAELRVHGHGLSLPSGSKRGVKRYSLFTPH